MEIIENNTKLFTQLVAIAAHLLGSRVVVLEFCKAGVRPVNVTDLVHG